MNKDEAQKLLPWYAVGALDADEMRAVAAHLEDSPHMQQELAECELLHQSVGEVGANEPVFNPAAINDALREIDAYEASRPADRSSPAQGGLLSWLRETLTGGGQGAQGGTRLALAVQFALILGLGAMLLSSNQSGVTDDGAFITASGTDPAGNSVALAQGALINVIFQPDASVSQVQALLEKFDAQIVAGPSGQGRYTLRVGVEVADSVIVDLRRDAELVLFVREAD